MVVKKGQIMLEVMRLQKAVWMFLKVRDGIEVDLLSIEDGLGQPGMSVLIDVG